MKDFIQVGQPHSEELADNMVMTGYFIGIGMVLLMIAVKTAFDLKKKRKKPMVVYVSAILFSGLLGIFILVAGTKIMVYMYHTYSYVTDYQGTFKVVQSETDKIDTTSSEDPKITLEDNKGNQQVFEVSDNQVLHKGGKAVVEVKAYGKDKKPSLDKKMGQKGEMINGCETISIKPEK